MKRRDSSRLRRTSLATTGIATGLVAFSASAAPIVIDPVDVVISNPGDPSLDGAFSSNPYPHGYTLTDSPSYNDIFLGVTYTEGNSKSGTPASYGIAVAGDYDNFTITRSYFNLTGLAYGDSVDTLDFSSTGGALADWNHIGDGGYIAFFLEGDGIGMPDYYGWVALSRTAENEMTIHSWAYQQAGSALTAGQGITDLGLEFVDVDTFPESGGGGGAASVSDPAVPALLLAGALAGAMSRRLRARA